MEAHEAHRLHVVVFPWLAFGHMLPHLELSKALARRGHSVSYLSTPRNISRLPPLSGDLAALITFVPLSLPPVDGLPENAEATSDLAAGDVQYLYLAFDGLKTPFAEFLKTNSPPSSSQKPVDWIVVDFTHYWAPPIAADVGDIPCVFFSVFIASSLAYLGPVSEIETKKEPEELTKVPSWFPFSVNFAYSLYWAREIASGGYKIDASGVSVFDRFKLTIQGCKVVSPRSCMEIELDCLRLLGELYAPSPAVVPVGLLPPLTDVGRKSSASELVAWLDEQRRSTVVYVAFGSEATLRDDLLKELAAGLEMSRLPFLWALKKSGDLPAEVLPERDKDMGLVVTEWVPQIDLLAHPSVGAFLTHSGWSSVVEAMQYGLPLVLLPIFADQEVNACVVASKGFGVQLHRNEGDGRFDRKAVAAALRKVVVEEEGEEVRVKAREMKEVFGDKDIHDRYVDSFVEYLRDHRRASTSEWSSRH